MYTKNKCKNVLVGLSFFLSFLLSSCSTVKNDLAPEGAFVPVAPVMQDIPQPAWFPAPEEAYPKADYIVQLAEGGSDKEAQSLAMQAVSRYISTNIETEFVALKVNDKFDYYNQIKLTTDMELFGLQCSEGWFCKDTGKWYAVAFINRAEAWGQYAPVIEQERRAFMALYEKAEAEPEPFFANPYYREALEKAPDFIATLVTARLISPEFEKRYDPDRDAIASIPVKIDEAYSDARALISVSNDLDRKIASCLSEVFTGLGFKVVTSKGRERYVIEAFLEDNISYSDDMVLGYPSMELVMTNAAGSEIFTWSCSLGKNAAYTLERVRQRNVQAISTEISGQVAEAFRQQYPEM